MTERWYDHEPWNLAHKSMLLITTTHKPAWELGYLLHKNPAHVARVELPFGAAVVVYPEVSDGSCTVAVLLEIDAVGLVRGSSYFDQYVNDRPYVASSFLSTALGRLFGTAMSGRSKERQELADAALPFEVEIPVLPTPSPSLVHQLFAPLGYEVECEPLVLDEQFPEWGSAPYCKVVLRANVRVRDLLSHLSVLIPALDNRKHYFVNKDEVDKLLRKGGKWLEDHPEKVTIARRYLRHEKTLVKMALDQLEPEEEMESEVEVDKPMRLHDQRHEAVVNAVMESGAKSVLDLGCGDGKLTALLLKLRGVKKVTGMDVSVQALEHAARRLRLDRLGPRAKERVSLLHGSLVYRDARLEGYDVACVVEVIEHLDAERLRAFENALFKFARPGTVVLTTPNREYNVLFQGMAEEDTRHGDHRFEWTRAEFEEWASRVANEHGYKVSFQPIGPFDETHGAPSQMGVFVR